MGARKRHQPRRGSLAYSRRVRAKTMEARIRAWPSRSITDEPKILAHCGFKAGCVQVVSIDDREKVPNAGKQLVSLGTVLVTPPVLILGIRGYSKELGAAVINIDEKFRIKKKINLNRALTIDEKKYERFENYYISFPGLRSYGLWNTILKHLDNY